MLLRVKALIRHAMASLFPKTEKWPGVAETGLHDFVERFLRDAPFMVRLGLYLGSWVFALAPLITIGVPLPSFLLPGKMRDRYAAKVATHPVYLIRQAVFVVKMAAGLCWAAHPSMRANLNLPVYPLDPGTFRTQ